MRRATQFLPVAILIVIAGVVLGGCVNGIAEVRYVNRTNAKEVLTLKHSMTMKTQIIHTFHGISNGSYTLKTEAGATSGTFASDGGGFKFRSEDGKAETVKIKPDGSFDYAHGTWALATDTGKELKAVASKEGAAQ